MIIQFELTQEIAYPIDKAFRFLADFSNMPKWNYYIQQVTQLTPGPFSPGTEFEQKRPHDTHTYKITHYLPPHQVTVEMLPPGPHFIMQFNLRECADATRVTYTWKVDLDNYKLLKYIPSGKFKNWLLSFAKKHILRVTKPAVEQNFYKLKVLLEQGTVVLQDGRESKLN